MVKYVKMGRLGMVFRQGDVGDKFYIIYSGSVAIYVKPQEDAEAPAAISAEQQAALDKAREEQKAKEAAKKKAAKKNAKKGKKKKDGKGKQAADGGGGGGGSSPGGGGGGGEDADQDGDGGGDGDGDEDDDGGNEGPEVTLEDLDDELYTNLDYDLAYLGNRVAALPAGLSFGELALMNTEPRTASIICLEDTEFMTVEKADYDRILKTVMQAKLKKKEEYFLQVSVLRNASSKYLAMMSYFFIPRKFQRNSVLIRQGDAADSVYFVRKGRCRIVYHTEITYDTFEYPTKIETRDTKVFDLANIGPHEYFGEYALLEGVPQPFTIIAETDVKLYEINNSDFRKKTGKRMIATFKAAGLTRMKWFEKRIEEVVSLAQQRLLNPRSLSMDPVLKNSLSNQTGYVRPRAITGKDLWDPDKKDVIEEKYWDDAGAISDARAKEFHNRLQRETHYGGREAVIMTPRQAKVVFNASLLSQLTGHLDGRALLDDAGGGDEGEVGAAGLALTVVEDDDSGGYRPRRPASAVPSARSASPAPTVRSISPALQPEAASSSSSSHAAPSVPTAVPLLDFGSLPVSSEVFPSGFAEGSYSARPGSASWTSRPPGMPPPALVRPTSARLPSGQARAWPAQATTASAAIATYPGAPPRPGSAAGVRPPSVPYGGRSPARPVEAPVERQVYARPERNPFDTPGAERTIASAMRQRPATASAVRPSTASRSIPTSSSSGSTTATPAPARPASSLGVYQTHGEAPEAIDLSGSSARAARTPRPGTAPARRPLSAAAASAASPAGAGGGSAFSTPLGRPGSASAGRLMAHGGEGGDENARGAEDDGHYRPRLQAETAEAIIARLAFSRFSRPSSASVAFGKSIPERAAEQTLAQQKLAEAEALAKQRESELAASRPRSARAAAKARHSASSSSVGRPASARPHSARSARSSSPTSARARSPSASGRGERPRSARAPATAEVVVVKSTPDASFGAYITPTRKIYTYQPTKEDKEMREDILLSDTPRKKSALFVRYESKYKKWADAGASTGDGKGGAAGKAGPGGPGGYSRATAELTLQQILKARSRATTAKAMYKATWKV